MLAYIFRRLSYVLVTMFLVSLFTFVLIFATGTPEDFLIPVQPGRQPSEELRQRIRMKYGLDRPVPVQYFNYMRNILRGDLGESWYFHRPVASLLFDRFPNTARLALLIVATQLSLGIPLGIFAAMHRNSIYDRIIVISATTLISIPSFLIAILLIYFFGLQLGWFNTGGLNEPKDWVLPVLSVAIPGSVAYAILLRTIMLNALGDDYARTARAKGLSFQSTVIKHILPNALIPIVTQAGIELAYLLSGIVLIEFVFGIPGIGITIQRATQQKDIPVVLGAVFAGAIFVGVFNMTADLIAARLDPRIRLEK
jgi:ABC-type dipeptide/oligopeptide/nickel transport system permease component